MFQVFSFFKFYFTIAYEHVLFSNTTHPGLVQVLLITDTREHQQVRGTDAAGADDDLFATVNRPRLTVPGVAHSAGSVVLVKDDPLDVRSGDEVESLLSVGRARAR